jgi:hypothetical protein
VGVAGLAGLQCCCRLLWSCRLRGGLWNHRGAEPLPPLRCYDPQSARTYALTSYLQPSTTQLGPCLSRSNGEKQDDPSAVGTAGARSLSQSCSGAIAELLCRKADRSSLRLACCTSARAVVSSRVARVTLPEGEAISRYALSACTTGSSACWQWQGCCDSSCSRSCGCKAAAGRVKRRWLLWATAWACYAAVQIVSGCMHIAPTMHAHSRSQSVITTPLLA